MDSPAAEKLSSTICLETKETVLLTGSISRGFFLSPSYIMYTAVEQGRNVLDREMNKQQSMVRSEKLNGYRKTAYNVD